MGYRSEVSIQLESKAFDMVMKSIKKYNSKQAGGYEFYPDAILKKDDEYIIQWNCVKWYSDYGDVKSIESVLTELDKYAKSAEIDGFRYDFLRVGEESDDIERRSNDVCYGSCFPETYIYTDTGFTEI